MRKTLPHDAMMSSTPRQGLVNKAAPGMVERAKASLQQKSIPTQETTLQIGLVELPLAVVITRAPCPTVGVQCDFAYTCPGLEHCAFAEGLGPIGHVGAGLRANGTAEHALSVKVAGRALLIVARDNGVV